MSVLYALYDGEELVCVAATRDGLDPGRAEHERQVAKVGRVPEWREEALPMVVHPDWYRIAGSWSVGLRPPTQTCREAGA